ncbi:DUF397 domain-containing protein [Streptomyces abikoensis]|uniref:DUF397 domain-containing protein n=1 Tax=Streptomyces abikoensis TaxID=97398 RepID=UPI0016761C69|nr:DUF397 domain-containing protein [Streptomyces abikoensis]
MRWRSSCKGVRPVDIQWRKSSFSEQPDGDCVELALNGGCALLRESDDPSAVLKVARHELRAFLACVRAGGLVSEIALSD